MFVNLIVDDNALCFQKCWPYSHPDGLAGPTGQVHDDEEEQYFERGSQPICDTTMMFDIQQRRKCFMICDTIMMLDIIKREYMYTI